MMLSKDDPEISNDEESDSGQLLRDIEEISQALYLDRAPSRAVHLQSKHQSGSATKAVARDAFQKGKKSSIWSWKPLKALTHIRSHRFNCFFFLHVHSIEGLPSNFNDLALCISWKRKDEVFRTHPVRVLQGAVEFEETLMHQSSVYASITGPHSSAKYEPKLFLLQVSVIGAPTLDIGKHWVDLARLLPLTLEELEEEKRTSGKWTTSFKLKGKAKGAMLKVSFGFSLLGNNPFDPNYFGKVSDITKVSVQTPIGISADSDLTSRNIVLGRLGNFSRKSSSGCYYVSSQSLDAKFLSEAFPKQKSELARSITSLYQKLDEEKFGNLAEVDPFHEHLIPFNSKSASFTEFASENPQNGLDDSDFVVIDQGVELLVKDDSKLDRDSFQSLNKSVIESVDVAEIFEEDLTNFSDNGEINSKHELDCYGRCESARGDKYEDENVRGKEATIEEPQMDSSTFLASESADMNLSPNLSTFIEHENCTNLKPSCGAGKMVRFLSLDDVTESVANNFLDMLGIDDNSRDMNSDYEPDSPREHLLKQFEKECCAFGNFILDLDANAEQMEVICVSRSGSGRVACSDDFDLSLVIQEAEKEHNKVTQSLRSRRNAKMLENLETEALMQKWGLSDKIFQNSPRITSGGFGSPVYIPPEEPSELPPLGDGLGPTVQTKGGGFLRSMNSSLFRRAKNGANLIMQVSNPVVLPAIMGSNVMEILQCWASVGAENMFIQANDLMPLEDITGSTIQQIVQETECSLEMLKRFDSWALLNDSKVIDHSFHMQKSDEELLFFQNARNLGFGSISDNMYSDCVSLEDLVPLALANIEALSIEGLRIQSGLSNEEAPTSIRPQLKENWSLIGKNVKIGGVMGSPVTALQLLDVRSNVRVDDLIKLSISLNEWIRLDAVDIDYEGEIDEQILKLLAAHRANFFDLDGVEMTRNCEGLKFLGSRFGLFGNYFTVALRLQLRDPFRDYEMVGASMLVLVEVEKVCNPLPQNIQNTKTEINFSNNEDDLNEDLVTKGACVDEKEKVTNTQVIPLFKISRVHVAGLNVEPDSRRLLITGRQLQSGSRWLLSSGMSRTSKELFSKSNAIVKPSSLLKKQASDILWSISSEVQNPVDKWKELAALNIHVRNPDIILPNEPVRSVKV